MTATTKRRAQADVAGRSVGLSSGLTGGSVRGSAFLVGLCVLFTLALRIPFLTWPLMPDEAGMLIIAQNWQEGPFFYGDYFVGRGVVLLLLFSLADALGGPLALRLLGCLVAAGLVIAAGWAGHHLQGRRGAGWAALVAASYASTYAFSASVMNGRMVAAALVLVSCACTIAAVRHVDQRSRVSFLLAALAGVASTCAVLVVQSYADGAVFAVVVLLVSWRVGILPIRAAGRIVSAGVLGMLLPVVALVVGVFFSWPTAAQVWFQMFGFRLEAVSVIGSSQEGPMERFAVVAATAALTGVLLLGLCFLLAFRQVRHRPRAPIWAGVLAMLLLASAGMALGGSWYPDYLLQLVPALTLGTALIAPLPSWSGLGMRAGAALAGVAAVVATYLGLERPILGTPTGEAAVGRWVASDAEPGDTALVLWGKANVIHEAGMASPPYPYLWSLLTRTLDPDLELLLTTLRGPDAPTWIVEWYDMNSWGLDESGDLADVVDDRYRYVGEPCGIPVYVLRSEPREPPPPGLCGEIPAP